MSKLWRDCTRIVETITQDLGTWALSFFPNWEEEVVVGGGKGESRVSGDLLTVLSPTVPSTTLLVAGSIPIWPEQNTRFPSRMAWDRKGGGAGASEERTALRSDIV